MEKEQRPITIDGYDKDGNLCRWTGFDKEKGTFWGKPQEEPKTPPKPKPRMGI